VTTHRPERVADVLRDVLALLLREEVRDPRVGFVTITEVKVSPDLRHARVYVSRLGDAGERAASIVALNHAVPYLRREVARRAGLRRTPDLAFVEDTVLASGFRVDHLLDEIRDQGATDEPGEGGTTAEDPEA